MKKTFKAYKGKFAESLESAFGKSQQVRIFLWLIQNAGEDNYIHATYNEIAEAIGASFLSVNKCMNKLQTCDPPFIIRKGRGGIYRLNPDIFPVSGMKATKEEALKHEKNSDTF